GYYHQTWDAARTAPAGTTLGVAFGGWADVTLALSDATNTFSKLGGAKYLDVGGGNGSGAWTAALITKLDANLAVVKNAGYVGICYDIEEGVTGLAPAFAASFANAKAAGLKVLVTISHSAPYGFPDAAAVMSAVFASASVDYLSPQLYTTGAETANDWATSGGVAWTSYAGIAARVVPSVARAGLYASAQATFATYGVTTWGYVAWS
ncbi:hypothetical protein JKP88DRAFT_141883, partial [Tribonema minus]